MNDTRHDALHPAGVDEHAVLLAARDVVVTFGGLTALDGVSVALPAREIHGLIGPNGAGKSTLFGVLTGFVAPASGHVELGGVDITRMTPHRRARLGLGRSFQQTELFRSLTVAEHLLLAYRMGRSSGRAFGDIARLDGWRGPAATERQRVEDLLDLLGLCASADRACVALPTGAARLVEVGKVLAMGSRVIMLDEPAAGLDARETEDLDHALRLVMAEEDVSMLIVEHDLEFVFGLCSWITVLDAGAVIAAGSPEAVKGDQAVQEAYLGARYAE